jgi:hypothetical protein
MVQYFNDTTIMFADLFEIHSHKFCVGILRLTFPLPFSIYRMSSEAWDVPAFKR